MPLNSFIFFIGSLSLPCLAGINAISTLLTDTSTRVLQKASQIKATKKVSEKVEQSAAEIICLAGFMRLVTPWFVERWFDRLINIHPSLLPEFKGADAVGDAIKAGAKKSGCTVHFVREEMDSGPIILQAEVEVLQSDSKETLAARILKEEHRIYAQALKMICEKV